MREAIAVVLVPVVVVTTASQATGIFFRPTAAAARATATDAALVHATAIAAAAQ